jgi:hypothetical protein
VVALLDLFSTSQKSVSKKDDFLSEIGTDLRSEMEFQLEQSRALEAPTCSKHAPFIFYIDHTGKGRLVQGCCNDWTCPRCGQIRAREEYGKIVEGCRTLANAGHTLYFWTITCRGKECDVKTAETNYLLWTNRLLSSCRYQAKTAHHHFAYVQVTERQKRKHPHSHLITTYAPKDAVGYSKHQELPNGRRAKHNCLWSAWFREANIKSGLGSECDISQVENPIAVAVYVSKYLFKDAMATKFEKGWKRVRYSQNFPRREIPKSEMAFPLIKLADWRRLAALDMTVYADDEYCYEAALARLVLNVVPAKRERAY